MQDDEPVFRQEVRRSLLHLHDLGYLGACPLNSMLLPNVSSVSSSTEERGMVLQRMLRETLERLKPQGGFSEGDLEGRPYYVLYYRYVEELKRQEVLDRLAISASTFKRAQRKAIAAMCDFLRELHLPLVSPWPLPRVEQFVGREEELAAYRRRLEREGFAVIVGPPGAGKTALGAELASRRWAEGRPVLWVTLRNGRNVTLEALLESIALSLAAQGRKGYWRFLQIERRKQVPLSPDSQVRYLLTILERDGYTLCLDDYQLVNENLAIDALCADLLWSARWGKPAAVQSGAKGLWLLVMSRVTPHFIRGCFFEPLGGLGREDARRLLAASGLSALPEAVFAELYARTGGLPVFLRLFAAWACSRGLDDTLGVESEEVRRRLAAFAENMVEERDVRSYLLREVYQTLSPQEQHFLTCVTVFRLPFETKYQPVIDLLAAEGVEDIEATWIALAERHIFTRLEGQEAITLHPLVRAYFRQRLCLSPDERERLHRRVGEYYERSVGDVLEAAYHYCEAGERERAARLLSENVTQLIDAGQAGLALEQLERLSPALVRTAGAASRFEAAAAREQLCHLLGRREKQKAALSTMRVLALSEELDDPSTVLRRDRNDSSGQAPRRLPAASRLALVHNRWADFHRVTGDYAAAIAAAQAGLEAARRAGDQAAEVESLHRWGVALRLRGDYEAARERHQQALALAREMGDRQGQADNLNDLGNVCFRLRYLTTARDIYQQALALRRAIGDRQGEASALNNLGTVYDCLGDYAAAWDFYEQALAFRQSIGDRLNEAGILNNLGVVCCEVGDYAAARDYCERSLAIARAIGERRIEMLGLNNLGAICNEEGNYAAARAYHEQSLVIARAIGDLRGIGSALAYLGMALEGLEEMDEAEAACREALDIHRELGQVALAIEDLAGLARVALAEERGERREEARGYVEECLAHIAAHGVEGIMYVFEVYLTCARVLEVCGERQRARGVLEEAHALLVERADKIGDLALRRSFLENVSANREVAREWERVGV